MKGIKLKNILMYGCCAALVGGLSLGAAYVGTAFADEGPEKATAEAGTQTDSNDVTVEKKPGDTVEVPGKAVIVKVDEGVNTGAVPAELVPEAKPAEAYDLSKLVREKELNAGEKAAVPNLNLFNDPKPVHPSVPSVSGDKPEAPADDKSEAPADDKSEAPEAGVTEGDVVVLSGAADDTAATADKKAQEDKKAQGGSALPKTADLATVGTILTALAGSAGAFAFRRQILK